MVDLFATLAAFILVMVVMSVGVIFMGRSIKGSCGGLSGELDSCEFCPNSAEEKRTCERRAQREAEETLKGVGA